MTNASSMHEAGRPKPVLWNNIEGWSGEGGGRGFRMGQGNTHTYGQFTLMYGKDQYNIAK